MARDNGRFSLPTDIPVKKVDYAPPPRRAPIPPPGEVLQPNDLINDYGEGDPIIPRDFAFEMKQTVTERTRDLPRSPTASDKDEMDIWAVAEWHSALSMRTACMIGDAVMRKWGHEERAPTGMELAKLLSDWAFETLHRPPPIEGERDDKT